MNEVTTREAVQSDLPTLRHFEQGLIDAERPFDPTIQEGDILYYDLEYMLGAPHIHLIVAESNGELIGCGYARIEEARHYLKHKQHAYIGFMYTLPAYRGKGVNKIVAQALLYWAREQNITEAMLDVYYDNEAAIKAYEKSGFSRHLITMRKSITQN
jgi:RimJ/RimL family protein N-acetyltransferase